MIFPFGPRDLQKKKSSNRQLRTAAGDPKRMSTRSTWIYPRRSRVPSSVLKVRHRPRRLFFFGDIYNKNSRWGITIGGGFKDFLFSSRKLGKIPILTHIFQMGRNHQLDNYSISKNKQQKGPNKKKHTHLEMIYLQNKTEIFRSEQSGVQGGFIPFFEWKFRFQIFFIFTPIWGRFPIRLIFFKGVETTNYVVFFGFEKTSFAA